MSMRNDENSSDWRAVLEQEFAGGEGSFILQLRGYARWDKAAHARLFIAMRECCKAHDGETHIERWIADGFHFFCCYVMDRFANSDDKYQSNAAVNFDHLAYWLFSGQGRADDEFEPTNSD